MPEKPLDDGEMDRKHYGWTYFGVTRIRFTHTSIWITSIGPLMIYHVLISRGRCREQLRLQQKLTLDEYERLMSWY